ncbi:protein gamma response 1 [Euphorbia lathyris]|uniref:protein gamma response 1 n=1 Tax=Euphorbia lathyris TaxID=212925 RepID=UPI003313CE61
MVEGKPEFSPKLGYPDETDDVKYVSKLSTILVATIQEAKDRISQIEYIFCTQLYSNFQAKSKSLQKIYLEMKKEAEDSWKEKEKDLLLQIEKLQLQNQETLEENRCLKLEKEKALVDLDEKIKPLLIREINQQEKIDKLEVEVRSKSKEVDEGLELHNRLLQLVQSNSYMIVDKTKQLNEYEEKTNKMLAQVKKLEQKIEELGAEIRKKSEEVANKEELTQDLYKRVESLMLALTKSGESVAQHENEKKELLGKSEDLEYNVCELQKKLRKKTEEHEEVKLVHAQLLQQIDVNKRKMLLQKSNGYGKKVYELQGNLSRSSKMAGKDSYEKLLQKIQLKDSQLLSLKEKTRSHIDAYKRLKSQYNYVCKKSGLTEENMLLQIKLEDESVSLTHRQNPETAPVACEITKVKTENEVSDGLEDDQVVKSIPMSSFLSPSSNHIASKCLPTAKSAPVIGAKRPASRWVDTRSRRCKDGPDPHDDFLDTPLENLKVTVNKAMNEKVHNPVPDQKDVHPEGSDEETQDNSVAGPENQQMLLPMAGQKEFKYVEPVRKKTERENLKGVECKQCKKFYDAVHSNEGNDVDDAKQNFRCEHHDGVSRHRYKYVPPMTPEGFWNIGFESEM